MSTGSNPTETTVVRVPQAHDAVQIAKDARLLAHLSRHRGRKVLARIREAARQLPRPAHRRLEGCGEGSSAPPRLPAGCAYVHPCMRLLGETRSCSISACVFCGTRVTTSFVAGFGTSIHCGAVLI